MATYIEDLVDVFLRFRGYDPKAMPSSQQANRDQTVEDFKLFVARYIKSAANNDELIDEAIAIGEEVKAAHGDGRTAVRIMFTYFAAKALGCASVMFDEEK